MNCHGKKHFKAIGCWGTISEVMRTNSIPSAVIKQWQAEKSQLYIVSYQAVQ